MHPSRWSFSDQFSEKDDKAKFVCVIDGLVVKRVLSKGLSLYPHNAFVLAQVVGQQSLNVAIQMKTSNGNTGRVYRFEIKRLPSQIVPEKTQIKVTCFVIPPSFLYLSFNTQRPNQINFSSTTSV